MPNTEEEFMSKGDLKFAASLLESSMRQTQALTNSIEDNLRAEIREWQESFYRLYHSVDKAAETVTTRELEHVLAVHEFRAGAAYRALQDEKK